MSDTKKDQEIIEMLSAQAGDCSDLFISQLSFWDKLNTHEKRLLAGNTHKVNYKKGSLLYGGDSDCIGVILVKKGQLRAYTLSDDGRDVTLYRLFPGDVGILTVSCALEAITFKVFIDAEEDTEILLTSASTFKSLADNNVHVKCFGYEKSTERLSEMLWTLQQILFLSADKRLALFLLEESENTGSDKLKLTHEQIARYMGSAREVVSRLLKYFSSEGMVKQGRGAVTIIDKEKLRSLAV